MKKNEKVLVLVMIVCMVLGLVFLALWIQSNAIRDDLATKALISIIIGCIIGVVYFWISLITSIKSKKKRQ